MTAISTDYVGTLEAATILGWSTHKVKRYAKAGRLPVATKLTGGTGAYLFNRSDIEALAEVAA